MIILRILDKVENLGIMALEKEPVGSLGAPLFEKGPEINVAWNKVLEDAAKEKICAPEEIEKLRLALDVPNR